MAFLRFAYAQDFRRVQTPKVWDRVRVASTETSLGGGLVERASEILQKRFNPEDWLLTHATIVASVDTYDVPNVKIGRVQEGSFQVNRKYPDYRIKPESDSWVNNNCFVPGTLVTMADGTVKPIEEVKVGERVLTHLGRSRPVLKTFRQRIDGEILSLSPRGTMERLFVTDEHPFFAFRANTRCVECQKPLHRSVRAISTLLGKFYCSHKCYRSLGKTKRKLLEEKVGEFVEAQNLDSHDFVASPLVQGCKEIQSLTLGKARLLGLFLAEGYYELYSYNSNERVGVCWAFHQDERTTLAQEVVDLLREEFGVEGVIREHAKDRGIHVTSKTNRDLVHFFESWVKGEGSKTKVLEGSLLRAPEVLQMEILRGWFEGDGSFISTKTDMRLTGSSASRSLINQLQLILQRLGVSSRVGVSEQEGRKRLLLDGESQIVSNPKTKSKFWTLSCGGGWIEDLVQETIYESPYYSELDRRGGVQQVPTLRFFKGYHLQMLGDVERLEYRGDVCNLEVEGDHSYLANGFAVHNCDAWERKTLLKSYPTFVGSPNYVEHIQIPEQSKGRILDACARDIGKSIYVDILIATERKHRKLISSLDSGELNSLSMGCSIEESTCTKCGHVAVDEPEMCSHVRYEKGNYFYDELGHRIRVAELCGHHSIDPTGGVRFIEASWVKVPAFTGAVLRTILKPHEISPDKVKRAQAILMSPPQNWTPETLKGMAKAATLLSAVRTAQFDFGDDEEEGDDGDGGGGGDKGILSQLEEKAQKEIIRRLQEKIRNEISPPSKPKLDDGSTITDMNIQRQASSYVAGLYRDSVNTIVKVASSDTALINGVATLNRSFGIEIPVHLYRVALRVGSTTRYRNLNNYLRACETFMSRTPTLGESKTLVRLGHLLARRSG